MCGRQARATVILLLFLFVTQTGCIYVAYLSDKINQATATNQGVLVATAGININEVKRQSSLPIGEGVGALYNVNRKRTYSQSQRFDWRLPDSNLLFKDCNSYSIHTDEETGETVTRIQIGTAQRFLTWAEVKGEMLDIEQRLLNNGWHPVVWKGEASSDRMHRELENPDFKQFDDGIADAAYEKGDLEFVFTATRARGQGTLDIAEKNNFLHYVLLTDAAYEARRSRELEEESQRINEMLRQKEAQQNQSQEQNKNR